MKRLIASISAAIAALAIAVPTASAATIKLDPPVCSCTTTIDGHLFVGMPYSDYVRDVFLRLPADTPTAVDLWLELRSRPDYQSLPPITTISTTAEVGGTVGDDGDDEDDGEGRF